MLILSLWNRVYTALKPIKRFTACMYSLILSWTINLILTCSSPQISFLTNRILLAHHNYCRCLFFQSLGCFDFLVTLFDSYSWPRHSLYNLSITFLFTQEPIIQHAYHESMPSNSQVRQVNT